MSLDTDRDAIARARDTSFADLITLMVGLAAESHPDLLQQALARVFDLSAVEETTKRMMLVVSRSSDEAHRIAAEVRELVGQVNADLDCLETRLDRMRMDVEKLEKDIAGN